MIEVQMVGTGPVGAPYYTTFRFDGTAESVAEEAASAVESFAEAVAPGLRNDMTFRFEGEALVRTPSTGQVTDAYAIAPWDIACGNNTEPLPGFVQGLVTLPTAQFINGRRLRGHFFLPGLCDDGIEGDSWAGTTQTFFQTGIDNLLDPVTAPLGVWHRPTSPSSSNGSFAVATAATLRGRVTSLRSRRA